MSAKLQFFLEILNSIFALFPKNPKGGRNVTHSYASFVLFFMIMFYKRIHNYQTMEKYLAVHYKCFGFSRAPSRKTIRTRFNQLPRILQFLIPNFAQYCDKKDHQIFGFSTCFIDKSVFRALGGLWHKKHMRLGVVPHSSIDVEASWAKSAYHGWRFGYGFNMQSVSIPNKCLCINSF